MDPAAMPKGFTGSQRVKETLMDARSVWFAALSIVAVISACAPEALKAQPPFPRGAAQAHSRLTLDDAMRLALMGVAVQTSVILYSFINKLRLEGKDFMTATYEASLLRLRPILMTALVACLGLLPAAMSTGIGSDSQKPFAIVIVGGLLSRLLISIFLAPVLYALVARKDDILKV
jgi:hypothetical protein